MTDSTMPRRLSPPSTPCDPQRHNEDTRTPQSSDRVSNQPQALAQASRKTSSDSFLSLIASNPTRNLRWLCKASQLSIVILAYLVARQMFDLRTVSGYLGVLSLWLFLWVPPYFLAWYVCCLREAILS